MSILTHKHALCTHTYTPSLLTDMNSFKFRIEVKITLAVNIAEITIILIILQ